MESVPFTSYIKTVDAILRAPLNQGIFKTSEISDGSAETG